MSSVRRSARLQRKAPDYNLDGSPSAEFTAAWSNQQLQQVATMHATPYGSWERVCGILACMDAFLGAPAILATQPFLRSQVSLVIDRLCTEVVEGEMGDNFLFALLGAKQRLDLVLDAIKKERFYRPE